MWEGAIKVNWMLAAAGKVLHSHGRQAVSCDVVSSFMGSRLSPGKHGVSLLWAAVRVVLGRPIRAGAHSLGMLAAARERAYYVLHGQTGMCLCAALCEHRRQGLCCMSSCIVGGGLTAFGTRASNVERSI
jgi:hypothetical protein